MITIKNKEIGWSSSYNEESETFWASYSDLMAGLLMIFALTMVITLLYIGYTLIEPTNAVREWKEVIDAIKNDKELCLISNIKINPDTGALVISDENLRFLFASSALSNEAKSILKQAVPKYMEIIHRYPEFLKKIEIIEISGHTDKKDARGGNPYYSRKRAGEVYDFLLKEPAMAPYEAILKSKGITAGYADTRYPPECEDDICAAARRVEIAVRLNDQEVLGYLLDVLDKVVTGEK
jgi:outer membrane protein OmpA-like peptidoglycan-associated protein